jgi:hypothetical protein
MATVLGKSDYLSISIFYTNALRRLRLTDQDLFDAVYAVVILDTVGIEPTVDLAKPLFTAYEENGATIGFPGNYVEAVRVVENHVIQRGSFSDVDAYLEATTLNGSAASAILVPQEWADLSEEAGFSITSSNIDSSL